MAQVRPAPVNGGSTSWEIHRCYPKMELSGYLNWTISSINFGSWTSWQKTLFHKSGSKVRPAPVNGGSTSWEIHRCYPKMELSGYLNWTISSINFGSWTSWQKTLFHKIGSNIDGNLSWSRPCMINLLTSHLIVWLVASLHFNPCLLFGLTISS